MNSPSGPSGLPSWDRISRTTATRVASSSALYSRHGICSEFAGAGTSGTSVLRVGSGRFGIWMSGRPGISGSRVLGLRSVVSGGPGSVVCATTPSVVRPHPVARPTTMPAPTSAVAVIRA